MVTTYLIITLIYSIFLVWSLLELNREHQKQFSIGVHSEDPITIIIPFRNEAANISLLLNNLRKINRSGISDIILIDDHSTDEGRELAQNIIQENKLTGIRIIASEKEPGKKYAIANAIEMIQTDWIIQTDADCTFKSDWANSFRKLIDAKSGFVAGPVRISGTGFFGKLLEVESWALLAITALAIQKNSPQMSNGGNMCWNRKFLSGEYEDDVSIDTDSGDDFFIMNSIHRQSKNSLRFNWSSSALVSTAGPETISSFFKQRIRWASKWKYSQGISQWLFPALLWLYHFVHIFLSGFLIINGLWLVTICMLILKGIAEYSLLHSVSGKFGYKIETGPFIFLQFLYSPYVVLFGLLSQFAKTNWK